MRAGREGQTLLEIILACSILAVLIPLFLNLLIPAKRSLQRAELLQVATSMALYRVEEVRYLDPVPGIDLRETMLVNQREYQIVREIYRVDELRLDVVVRCTAVNLPPVTLSTRYFHSR